MHFLCVSTLVSQICISVFTREGGSFLTSLLTEIRSTSLRKINLRNCIDLEKDHFLCPVIFLCVGAGGLIILGSLLTLAMQGITKVSSIEHESRGKRGNGMRIDLLALWWPEPPPWTEILGLPALIRLVI